MSEDPTGKLNSDSSFQARLLAELSTLNNRLASLENKVDERLRETRPIWEAVLSRLDGVESRLEAVELRLDGVESKLEGINTRIKVMDSKLDVLGHDLLETRAETELLKKRVPPAA